MRVVPIEPDLPVRASAGDAGAFGAALQAAADALLGADLAERAFARGSGGLQEAVIARSTADVLLQIATTAAARATASIGAVMNMQL